MANVKTSTKVLGYPLLRFLVRFWGAMILCMLVVHNTGPMHFGVDAWVAPSFSFHPSSISRTPQYFKTISKLTRTTSTKLKVASFDFSIPAEWESYYQEHSAVLEWHSSISFAQIASYLPTVSKVSSHQYAQNPNNSTQTLDRSIAAPVQVLLVGCGNSQLPGYLLQECPHVQLTLLDTSKACLEQMKAVYGDQVNYVCGDATRLDQYFAPNSLDIIVDKGLSDAIFCGEGWDGDIQRMLRGATQVLVGNSAAGTRLPSLEAGQYLLISYKLPASTHEFLSQVGKEVGLKWEFDLPPYTTEKVGISIGTKTGQ